MRRLFTFGCSFTQYCWPTWANILGQEYDKFENWGKPGAGNSFIFNSLIESIKRNTIDKDDTVIIMWTSIGREDRWVSERGWVTPGSIYNQDEYDKKFVTKWADPQGYLIRDLAFISAAQMILSATGCKWEFISLAPLYYYDDSGTKKNKLIIDNKLQSLYNKELSVIKPSVFEVVFKNNWSSRDKIKPLLPDDHPTPIEHLMYLDAVLPNYTISPETRDLVILADKNVILNKPFDWSHWRNQNIAERF